MDTDRWMVILGWVLLAVMVWQSAVSIYQANTLRTVVGVTGIAMALWALGVNRERLTRINRHRGPGDARTRRG